jgi:predicted dehydrogenase
MIKPTRRGFLRRVLAVSTAIEAARQGKDMYYEKPLGRTVAECQALRKAVERYGVIFQFGTQQRSSRDFRLACETARNHRIGELQTIMIAAPRSGRTSCDAAGARRF